MALYHIFFDEFPSSDHRGCDSAPFDIIVVKDKVNMHDGKKNKSPHQDVMDLPHVNISAKKRNDPGKQFGQKGLAHGCIHSEAGEALHKKDQECEKIDQAGQGVMANGIDLLIRYLQDIHFYHVKHFLPLAAFQGDVIVPPCKFIACNSPVKSKQEIKEKHKSGDKMDETHGPEPVIEGGLCTSHECGWITDDIAGDAKCDNACHIHPMVYSYGQFPHIDFPKGYGSAFHSSGG